MCLVPCVREVETQSPFLVQRKLLNPYPNSFLYTMFVPLLLPIKDTDIMALNIVSSLGDHSKGQSSLIKTKRFGLNVAELQSIVSSTFRYVLFLIFIPIG